MDLVGVEIGGGPWAVIMKCWGFWRVKARRPCLLTLCCLVYCWLAGTEDWFFESVLSFFFLFQDLFTSADKDTKPKLHGFAHMDRCSNATYLDSYVTAACLHIFIRLCRLVLFLFRNALRNQMCDVRCAFFTKANVAYSETSFVVLN